MPSAEREQSQAAQAGLWRVGGLVFLIALAVRGLHLWFFREASFFSLLVGDARAYDAWARRLAAGDWVGSEVFYQAPLYPYLLGVWYALVGPDLLTLRLLQIALGALACALVAVASGRLFGRNAGLAAGLLLAFYAPAIFFDLLVQKAVLDLLLVSLLLLLVSLLGERAGEGRSFWAGVALGLLVLSRENALLLLPVFVIWLWARSRPRVAPVVLCVLGIAAVLAPVAVRNFRIGGELQVTTAQLGPNLYIGNHDGATGSYVPLRPGRGDASFERRDAAELAEAESGRALTSGEVSRYWRERAAAWIRAHPGRWLELLGRKLLLAWNGEEAMDTEDLATHAEVSPPLRWLARVVHFGLLAPLALLGLWWSRERGRELWVLHASIAVYTASLVAFYVVARYRLPLVPMLAPFAGLALVELPARWRRGPASARLRDGLILVVAAVIVNLPLLPRLAGASGESLRALTHLNYAQAFAGPGEEARRRVLSTGGRWSSTQRTRTRTPTSACSPPGAESARRRFATSRPRRRAPPVRRAITATSGSSCRCRGVSRRRSRASSAPSRSRPVTPPFASSSAPRSPRPGGPGRRSPSSRSFFASSLVKRRECRPRRPTTTSASCSPPPAAQPRPCRISRPPSAWTRTSATPP